MPLKRSWAKAHRRGRRLRGDLLPADVLINSGHAALDILWRAVYALGGRARPLQRRLRAAMAVRRWRLLAALGIAGSVHAAIIGLVRFDIGRPTASAPMIEVTLLVRPSLAAPEHASHVAAANQRNGRGTAQRSRMTGQPTPAHAAPPPSVPAVASAHRPSAGAGSGASSAQVSAQTSSRSAARAAVAGRRAPGPAAGLAARKTMRAAYLATWRNVVEREGTRHYPEQAAAGARSLTLQVTLRADGSIAAARITRSSGSDSLDQAALDILRHAAPFPALPAALRARSRTFTFAYQWHFLPSTETASLSAP